MASKPLILAAALFATVTSARQTQTFSGTITDSECAQPGHASMRMGPTDADCTRACVVAHGAAYVLHSSDQIYRLSDQRLPGKFAGQKVRVMGTLDASTLTIRVESIAVVQ